MSKKVTLADIACQIGVSTVAVSNALSGKPGVSPAMREKIINTAEEMGYTSPSLNTKMIQTGNIGVIVPESYYGFSASFYNEIYQRVIKGLYQNNYYGILELISTEDEELGSIPRVVREGKVDGLILLGQLTENYIRRILKEVNIPMIFLDTYTASSAIDTVISDGYYGTYMLTAYLTRRGHKRIGFVGNTDATSSIADRFWGYRRALREARINFIETWEIPDRNLAGVMYEKMILKDREILDAYVCNCDLTAYKVIQNLEELGYEVPRDVSVVGFDNFVTQGMDTERITTYAVDMDRMTDVCIKTLLCKIRHESYIEGIQIVSGKIIIKNSTN